MEIMDYINYANEVKEGNVNALEAYITLKAAMADLEKALKDVQELAIDEASKYGQKSFKAFGANVEVRNGAGRWNYANVKAHSQLTEQLKYIEKMAQAGGGVTLDGEVIEPAVKVEGKSTIAISFK
jgi:hypothetical protein